MNRAQRRKAAKNVPWGEPGRTAERRRRGAPVLDRNEIALALELHMRGEIQAAAEIYRRFLDTQPNNARVLNLYGYALHQLGALDRALPLLNRSVSLDPENPMAHNNLGNALREHGALDAAVDSFRRAIALDPACAVAHNNLAGARHDAGALDLAVESYRRAIAIDAGIAQAHYNLGNVLRDRGDLDGAIASYRDAVAIHPGYAAAHNNLGNVLRDRGTFRDAIASYRQAVAADPSFALGFYNLAILLKDQRLDAEALTMYRAVSRLDPANDSARHMAAALGGETTAAAPPGFVRDTFDSYAPLFDRHLTDELGYDVPEMLRQAVERCVDEPVFERALDLGCGTGMVAAAFEGRSRSFEGVDLSPNMLSEADRKGLYRHLHEADIIDFLAAGGVDAGSCDLVTAGDVLIYVGDLEAVFAGVSRCLSDGGLFAFSVESEADSPYRLRPSGRYAQSAAYIRGLAIEHGFGIAAAEDVVVRLEREAPILGAIYVLEKRAA